MPARFFTISLVTKREPGIAARFVTLETKRAVVTKRAATCPFSGVTNKIWQSLEEGAGKRCSARTRCVSPRRAACGFTSSRLRAPLRALSALSFEICLQLTD